MQRTFRGLAAFTTATAVLLAACGGGAAPGGGTQATPAPQATVRIGSFDRPIVLAITPSQEVQRLTATGNTIAAALGSATGLRWKVQIPTSYAAQIEALCAGQADVGFIASLQMVLLLDKNCGTPILASLRNDETCKLSATYNSQILVRSDSGINDLNGLKGKKFAFVDAISASGHLFPRLTVKTKTGQDPATFFSQSIFAGGHNQAVLALYNGQVDGAASFGDARVTTVCGAPVITPGMPADILTKTKVIEKAGPIPNDGIAVARGLPPEIADQVKKALLDYSKSEAGAKVLADRNFLSWNGLQEVQPNFWDSMREAARLAGLDVAAEAAKTPRPPATPAPSPTRAP